MVYIHNGILLSHKKVPFAATQMQLEILILSEVSQKKKDKYHYFITYMWNLKYSINEPIYKTETDPQTERTDLGFPRGWEEEVG